MNLSQLRLSAPDSETQSLTIRLDLDENGRKDSIEISLSCEQFASLAVYFQEHVARHKIPIPSSLRPRGKPSLSIVADD